VLRTPSRLQFGALYLCPLHKLVQPLYQRELPLYEKQFGVLLQIFNILRRKGEINFKTGGIW
jgi:hypothetical protein